MRRPSNAHTAGRRRWRRARRRTFTLAEQEATRSVLRQLGDVDTIEAAPDTTDAYAVAVDLAARYRLPLWTVYDEIRRLYGSDDIPLAHVDELGRQIESQPVSTK